MSRASGERAAPKGAAPKGASKKRLIVNADDLGRTAGINSGIFEAHRHGLVTSATLMVGYPAAEDAAAALGDHPGLGVGLHVALTGQAPLLPPEQVPSLVEASGRFPSNPAGLERLSLSPGEVLAEAGEQLRRFRELTGRPPTHLDSHHHSHRHPAVCGALILLAREHGLPVRNASPEVGERLRQEGIQTTDAFVEEFFGEGARLRTLRRILGELGPGLTEIMCHPAHVDDELRRTSSYAEERRRELEVLTHPEIQRTAAAMGVERVHFGTAW